MGGKGDNDAFFRGNRRSPWWAVAFGMVGASVSGIAFRFATPVFFPVEAGYGEIASAAYGSSGSPDRGKCRRTELDAVLPQFQDGMRRFPLRIPEKRKMIM